MNINTKEFTSFRGHNGPVSMVTVFTNILQQERLFGLWRGMIPVSIFSFILYLLILDLKNLVNLPYILSHIFSVL